MKNLMFIALAIAVVVAIMFSPLGDILNQKKKELYPSPSVEIRKPEKMGDAYQLALKGYGAPDINLEQEKGKVLLINFWASWCPPCKAEMPSLNQLYNKYHDKMTFTMIALNDKEKNFMDFIKAGGYQFPVYTPESVINEKIMPQGIPQTYLISKNGDIVLSEKGSRDWNATDIHIIIDSLLAQP